MLVAGRVLPLDAVQRLTTPHIGTDRADRRYGYGWAVRSDDHETVQLLLQAGAAVHAANRYGITPLSLAAANGNAAIIGALLKAGADPNAVLP